MRLLYVADPVLGVPVSEVAKLLPEGCACVTPEELSLPRIVVRSGGDPTLNATELAKAYRAHAPVLACESVFFIRGKRANPVSVQYVWDEPAGFDDTFALFVSSASICQLVKSCRPLIVRSDEECRRDDSFKIGALWCVPRPGMSRKGKGMDQLRTLLRALGEAATLKSALAS